MANPTARASTRSEDDAALLRSVAEPLRDIARSGIAGAIVGLCVTGVGGRLVMRFATILHEDRVGRVTENGNVIGDITPAGTLAVLLFGGLLSGLALAAVWAAVAPWIPSSGTRRALFTSAIAVALTGCFLVDNDNPDFLVLRQDPAVIALLLALVAISGFAMAMADTWLDRRLPAATGDRQLIGYGILAAVGAAMILPIAIGFYFAERSPTAPTGLALVVVGGATLVRWLLRGRGRIALPAAVLVAGRGGLAAAVGLGAVALTREVMLILD